MVNGKREILPPIERTIVYLRFSRTIHLAFDRCISKDKTWTFLNAKYRKKKIPPTRNAYFACDNNNNQAKLRPIASLMGWWDEN